MHGALDEDMVTRKLILGTTAALALAAFGCSRSHTPAPAVQTPARAADNMNVGPGYYGGAAENINRPSSTPNSVGGGPASETMEHSDMDHSGVDPSSGAPSTSAPSKAEAESDMTGDPWAGEAPPKAKKKTK
jgi:hypothetical protein